MYFVQKSLKTTKINDKCIVLSGKLKSVQK